MGLFSGKKPRPLEGKKEGGQNRKGRKGRAVREKKQPKGGLKALFKGRKKFEGKKKTKGSVRRYPWGSEDGQGVDAA